MAVGLRTWLLAGNAGTEGGIGINVLARFSGAWKGCGTGKNCERLWNPSSCPLFFRCDVCFSFKSEIRSEYKVTHYFITATYFGGEEDYRVLIL